MGGGRAAARHRRGVGLRRVPRSAAESLAAAVAPATRALRREWRGSVKSPHARPTRIREEFCLVLYFQIENFQDLESRADITPCHYIIEINK